MAFKVRKTNHRAWPVTVKLQECDAQGSVVEIEQTFVAHWRPTTEEGRKAIQDELATRYPLPEGRETLDMPTTLRRNADYFGRLIVGWGSEVQDESGLPIAFSVEQLASMITGPDGLAISTGLVHADNEQRYGIAPTKNSKTSPAPGESSGAGEVGTNSPTT